MSVLTIPVQLKTPPSAGLTPTSLLQGELAIDHYLGRLWWADNNGNKQFASLPAIATAAQQTDLTRVLQNLLYTALLVAALRGVPDGLVDGVVDPFSTTADVNASKSSGYTFNSSAGTIGASPIFTTVSAQSTAIADSTINNRSASLAFDGNTGTCWESNATGSGAVGVAYVGQDFGSGNAYAIAQVVFTSALDSGSSFSSGLFQYSDNPAASSPTWTTAATLSLPTALQTTQTYSIPNVGAHRAWRLLSNAAGQYNPEVCELTMQTSSTAAMTLQSATLASAVASPSAGRVLESVSLF